MLLVPLLLLLQANEIGANNIPLLNLFDQSNWLVNGWHSRQGVKHPEQRTRDDETMS